MNRGFDKWQQLERAKRIRTGAPHSWDKFLRLWCAFNALYCLGEGNSELEKITSLIGRLPLDSCANVITNLASDIVNIPVPPPGDMRFTDDDVRYRSASDRWAEAAKSVEGQPVGRLNAVMFIVYRVRCNVVHGSKEPDDQRDTELVEWAVGILSKVLPDIEEGLRH